MSTSSSAPNDTTNTQANTPWWRSPRRLIVFGLLAVFFAFVVYEMIDPFPDKPYIVVPHGDHVHYVPKDRDPDARMTDFPTVRPEDNERIMPDGRVVEVEPGSWE